MSKSIKRKRDLMIEAAIYRLILIHKPEITQPEIQARAETLISSGRYTCSIDGKPIVMIELESKDRFRITIL